MIEVKNVIKIYGHGRKRQFRALNGVNLILPDCGLVALYGENGCGKTTLLNIISGADQQYSGEVYYNGQNIEKDSEGLRRNILSMVFQETGFIPYLNVVDNIRLFSENESEEEAEEYLAKYGLADKKNNSVFELSGGQKQRISIIRGIIKRKCILLVDEPTSSLNAEMEQEVFKQLKELSEDNLVVFVSHNLTLIRRYSDLVLHMENGAIVSAENNYPNMIEYTDDVIFVSENFYNLGAIEESEIKSRLDQKGGLSVKVKKADEKAAGQSSAVTKSLPLKPYEQSKKLGAKFKTVFIRKMLLYKPWTTVIVSLVSALLLVAGLLLLSVTSVDADTVTYEHLAESEMQYIPFDEPYRIISGILESKKEFNNTEAARLRKNADTGILYGSEMFLEPLCEGYTPFYDTEVNGVAFCHEDDVSLACGKYPNGRQIMITDFLAKSLVTISEEYENFDDILQKGIKYYGRELSVSGIVETNYERYLVVATAGAYGTPLYTDYEYCRDNLFHKIFYPLETFEENDDIWFMFSEDLNSFVDIISMDESLIYERLDPANIAIMESHQVGRDGRMYLNQTWNQMQQDNYLTNLYNKEFMQVGKFETIAEYPVAMASRDVIDLIKNTFETQQSDFYLLNLKSKNDIVNLDSYDIHYIVRGANTVDETLFDIYSITYYMYRFLLIVGTVLLLATIIIIGTLLNAERKTFAYMRIAGYSKRSRIIIGSAKILTFFSLTAILTIALGIFAIIVVNDIIKVSSEIEIEVLRVTLPSVLFLLLMFVSCFAVATIVNYLLIRNKDIKTLLSE